MTSRPFLLLTFLLATRSSFYGHSADGSDYLSFLHGVLRMPWQSLFTDPTTAGLRLLSTAIPLMALPEFSLAWVIPLVTRLPLASALRLQPFR